MGSSSVRMLARYCVGDVAIQLTTEVSMATFAMLAEPAHAQTAPL